MTWPCRQSIRGPGRRHEVVEDAVDPVLPVRCLKRRTLTRPSPRRYSGALYLRLHEHVAARGLGEVILSPLELALALT
jgi:hypothetical protein